MNQYNHISYSIYRCKYLPTLQTSGFLNTLLSGWDKLINQVGISQCRLDAKRQEKCNKYDILK